MVQAYELPAELTIYSVLDTRDALLAWVAEQTASGAEYLAISAAAVEEIDGAGLQLLAALSNMDQAWHVVHSSSAFSQACRTLGFAAWLDPRFLQSPVPEASP